MEIRLKFTIRAMRLSLSLKPLKLGSWFHVKRNQQKKPQKEDASHSVFGNLAQSPIRPIPIPNPLVGSFSSGLDPMTHPQATFVLGASGIFVDRTKERPKSYKPMTKASRAKGKSSTRGQKAKKPQVDQAGLKTQRQKNFSKWKAVQSKVFGTSSASKETNFVDRNSGVLELKEFKASGSLSLESSDQPEVSSKSVNSMGTTSMELENFCDTEVINDTRQSPLHEISSNHPSVRERRVVAMEIEMRNISKAILKRIDLTQPFVPCILEGRRLKP